MLHKIGKQCNSPRLDRPRLQLYGKDDASQLKITAETVLTIEADGHTVNVPVFVQPGSEQLCLLGTNVTLPLKLKFLKANRDPINTEMPSSVKPVVVSLIQTETIPARNGRFIEAA